MKKMDWLKAFNVSDEQFSTWTKDKPKEIDTTFWCLEKGYLNQHQYLAWAQKFYQIACLNSDFQGFKIAPSFWQQIKDVVTWPASIVPLCLWDNTVFILTTHPLDMNWSFAVNYILGSPDQILFYRKQLNLTNKPNSRMSPTEQTESPMLSRTPKAIQGEPFSLQEKKIKTENKPVGMPEIPQAKNEVIEENRDKKIEPRLITNTGFTGTNIVTMADLARMSQETPAPENMPVVQLDEDKKLSVNDPPTENELLSFDSLNNDAETITEMPEGLSLAMEPALPPEVKKNEMPLPEVPEGLDGFVDEHSVSSTPLQFTKSSIQLENLTHGTLVHRSEDIDTPSLTQAKTTPTSASAPTSFTASNKKVHEHLNKNFKKYLIVKLSNKNLILKTQLKNWDLKVSKLEIALSKEPNLFNFCLLSKKSFHGKVSTKDAMKAALFQALEINSQDAHLTVVPIISDNHQVDHFIIALGEQENLHHLEKLEDSLTEIKKELTA